MQKHEREALAAVQRLHPDVEARVEGGGGGGHSKLVATIDGKTVTLTLASSPRDPDHMVNIVRQQARRMLIAKGVAL
jgi:hypothetical protein